MEFSKSDVSIEKIGYHDMDDLQKMFIKAFSDEVDVVLLGQRIRRVRQFYYLLRPLSTVSPWLKNLFNIYVLRICENMVGFVQLSYLNHKQIHIDFIAVNKQYRGQGLGTWILRNLIEKVALQHRYDIVLEVREDNPACNLYGRLGFATKARVLHYEKKIYADEILQPEEISGLRELKDTDRSQLYRLYQKSVPGDLRCAIPRDHRQFHPSMFIRHMELVKNYLLRTFKKEFVVEMDDKIVASLEIRSYPKSRIHIINAMVDIHFESMRGQLITYALYYLQQKYKTGSVSVTIYDDMAQKQVTLEQMGFVRETSYFLMVRPFDLPLSCKSAHRLPKVSHGRHPKGVGQKLGEMAKLQK